MNPHAVPTFVERLERLERENRRWRWGAAITLVIGLGAAMAGADDVDAPKVVEAERFVVRDRSGKLRAVYGMAGDGEATILSLTGKDGRNGAILQSTPDDVGSLFLYGVGKRLSVSIQGESKVVGTPALRLSHNEEESLNLVIPWNPGQPVMTLTDKYRRVFAVPVRQLEQP